MEHNKTMTRKEFNALIEKNPLWRMMRIEPKDDEDQDDDYLTHCAAETRKEI